MESHTVLDILFSNIWILEIILLLETYMENHLYMPTLSIGNCSVCFDKVNNCAIFFSLFLSKVYHFRNEDHEWFIRKIFEQRRSNGLTMYRPGGDAKSVASYRYFTHRKVLYIWYDELNAFHRVFNLDHQVPCNEMHNRDTLSTEQAEERFAAYGSNEIYVELKPIWRLLFQEVT